MRAHGVCGRSRLGATARRIGSIVAALAFLAAATWRPAMLGAGEVQSSMNVSVSVSGSSTINAKADAATAARMSQRYCTSVAVTCTARSPLRVTLETGAGASAAGQPRPARSSTMDSSTLCPAAWMADGAAPLEPMRSCVNPPHAGGSGLTISIEY